MTRKLQQVGDQLLPVIAYGDAAGLPVETKAAEEISEKYGVINTLLVTTDNPYFEGEHEPGIWSDDTQLSLAVTRALIRSRCFDLEAIAEEHQVTYSQTPTVTVNGKTKKRGWGKGTQQSVERLITGAPPTESGSSVSTGNGVVIKLAPLVYWQFASGVGERVRHNQYDQLTNMTHNTDVARICTRVHGDVLYWLLERGGVESLGEFALARALEHEATLAGSNVDTSTALEYLANRRMSREFILTETDAKGFYVPQTLAMAYGNVILNSGDFSNVVYGAVNLGGDTDSIASISGTAELFAHGRVTLPDDVSRLDDIQGLRDLSRGLRMLAQ